jgi:hypothetical protein
MVTYFVWGAVGAFIYQTLSTTARVRNARREGRAVPPIFPLAVLTTIFGLMGGASTFFTLHGSHNDAFAASAVGVMWAAFVALFGAFFPIRNAELDVEEARTPSGPTKGRVVASRFFGWFSSTRVSALAAAGLFLLTLLRFLVGR